MISLTFAKLSLEDLPFLAETRNECKDFLHSNKTFNLEEVTEWFTKYNPDFYLLMDNLVPIGYFRLSNHNHVEQSIYVGADINVKFRGRGLAVPVYEMMLSYLKDVRDIKIARLEVLSNNVRAIHIYIKLGFKVVRTIKEYTVRDGVSINSIVMEKTLA